MVRVNLIVVIIVCYADPLVKVTRKVESKVAPLIMVALRNVVQDKMIVRDYYCFGCKLIQNQIS